MSEQLSQCSDWLLTGRPGFISWQRFLSSPVSIPALGLYQALSVEIKRTGREAGHSPRSNGNAWRYTSTPPYAFVASCWIKRRGSVRCYPPSIALLWTRCFRVRWIISCSGERVHRSRVQWTIILHSSKFCKWNVMRVHVCVINLAVPMCPVSELIIIIIIITFYIENCHQN